MTVRLQRIVFSLLLLVSWGLLPANAAAQTEAACQSTHIVDVGDSLWNIALATLGKGSQFELIVQATNAQAATDSSFAVIQSPSVIREGWKLCIPANPDEAEAAEPEVETSADSEEAASEETSNEEAASKEASAEMAGKETGASADFILIQMNDVYEVTPVSGGTQGGLARVATLRKQLLAENPHTYTILSGDMVNPSALGTAKVDGERLAGKQVVAVMNVLGLDYATFGNHEFDLNEEQFLQRLDESEFTWFASNAFAADGQPFPNVPDHVIFTVDNGQNAPLQVGMFGLMIDKNQPDYVSYTDVMEATQAQIDALAGQVDVLIAVTHLQLPEDRVLAQTFPEIDLIVGGHEHENSLELRGQDFTPIAKADANARSVWVHRVSVDQETGEVSVVSNLKLINASLPDDPEVAAEIDSWLEKAFAGFKEQGFEPEKIVTQVTEALDGTEASVRNRSTRLTDLIAQGMQNAAPDAQLAIFNGGSIRIDDTIPPGSLTEYDVIRVLPFGGTVLAVEFQGELLQKVLDQGQANQGTGGYLQTTGVERSDEGGWLIGGEALDATGTYVVAINDFLLTGFEIGLDYLTLENPGLSVQAELVDIRNALIDELQLTYGAANP